MIFFRIKCKKMVDKLFNVGIMVITIYIYNKCKLFVAKEST